MPNEVARCRRFVEAENEPESSEKESRPAPDVGKNVKGRFERTESCDTSTPRCGLSIVEPPMCHIPSRLTPNRDHPSHDHELFHRRPGALTRGPHTNQRGGTHPANSTLLPGYAEHHHSDGQSRHGAETAPVLCFIGLSKIGCPRPGVDVFQLSVRSKLSSTFIPTSEAISRIFRQNHVFAFKPPTTTSSKMKFTCFWTVFTFHRTLGARNAYSAHF